MKYGRLHGAGAYDPQHGFVMTGGIDDYWLRPINVQERIWYRQNLNSAEKTTDGVEFANFERLPLGLSRHCLVSLRNGGDMFVTGGQDSQGMSNRRTLIFLQSSGNWNDVKEMKAEKKGLHFPPINLVVTVSEKKSLMMHCKFLS